MATWPAYLHAPATVAPFWARGVLRDLTRAELAGISRNYWRNAVPVLDHHHGLPAGYLRAVAPHGRDLWFTAFITSPAIRERLRRGAVDVSPEMEGRNVLPRPDERGVYAPLSSAYYRGQVGNGWTLTAVAVLRAGDRPAAPGSRLWLV